MKKRGQSVSSDAIFAIALFVVVAIIFFFIVGQSAKQRQFENLKQEAQRVPDQFLVKGNLSDAEFIVGNKIDSEKLTDFADLTYDELRGMVGISSDFCVHFEDLDGNLIEVGGKTGIGSPRKKVNGTPCS